MPTYDAKNSVDWAKIDNIQGWFNQKEAVAMQHIVKNLPEKARVVELGSFQGKSSVVIAASLPADSILYCIDHFKGSLEHQHGEYDLNNLFINFRQNIERFNVTDKIRILVMSTTEAGELFADQSIDLVFVDAAHDYDSVRADLLCWYPKLKSGGLLISHDFGDWPGVTNAIKSLDLAGMVIAGSLWLHEKRSFETDINNTPEDDIVQLRELTLSLVNKSNDFINQLQSINTTLADIFNPRRDITNKEHGEKAILRKIQKMRKKKSRR